MFASASHLSDELSYTRQWWHCTDGGYVKTIVLIENLLKRLEVSSPPVGSHEKDDVGTWSVCSRIFDKSDWWRDVEDGETSPCVLDDAMLLRGGGPVYLTSLFEWTVDFVVLLVKPIGVLDWAKDGVCWSLQCEVRLVVRFSLNYWTPDSFLVGLVCWLQRVECCSVAKLLCRDMLNC